MEKKFKPGDHVMITTDGFSSTSDWAKGTIVEVTEDIKHLAEQPITKFLLGSSVVYEVKTKANILGLMKESDLELIPDILN